MNDKAAVEQISPTKNGDKQQIVVPYPHSEHNLQGINKGKDFFKVRTIFWPKKHNNHHYILKSIFDREKQTGLIMMEKIYMRSRYGGSEFLHKEYVSSDKQLLERHQTLANEYNAMIAQGEIKSINKTGGKTDEKRT